MDSVFPLGFPASTAVYLSLYVITLVIHVIFMNYVLAGSAYVAFVSVFTGGESLQRQRSPVAMLLRDWMPFALGLAITAGVAPLLFVQILYQRQFYTANILLFHRWMLIVPVLVIAYYLIYLLKSRTITHWAMWVRGAVGLGAFMGFAFTAYSWTENHLLSLQDQAVWSDFYASGRIVYWSPVLLPRLGVWFFGAFPTMSLIVAWQMYVQQHRGYAVLAEDVAHTRLLGVSGLTGAIVCGLLYLLFSGGSVRGAITSSLALPFLILAIVGVMAQLGGWLIRWQATQPSRRRLILLSVATLLTIVSATVLREAVRLSAIDVTKLYEHHQEAARSGGIVLFGVFFVINMLAIIYAVQIVKRRVDLD